MNTKQFIKDAIRTESPNYFPQNHRIEHAIDGCVTEAGELQDALKKAKYYGKPLDIVNLKEEAGDLLYYLAILFDEINTDFETEMGRVINKLKVRYPSKFDATLAQDRDLKKEREVLESE